MDENIDKFDGNDIVISTVILNHDKDIKLLRGFEIDEKSNNRYMRNVVIMIENEFVTSMTADTLILQEELAMFNIGDSQNKYFYPISRTINKEVLHSLEFTFDDGRKIYITKSQARAMVKLWNMSLQKYSFARLLEFEQEQSLETWTIALERNGYLLED